MRFSRILSLSVLSIAFGQSVSETRLTPQLIRNPRPLLDAAYRLQKIYGGVLTYEDPLLEAPEDLRPRGELVRVRGAVSPVERVFRLPIDTAAEPDFESAIRKTLAAYNQESGGPQFELKKSSFGLHLIPIAIQSRDHQQIPANNPLDHQISVAAQQRNLAAHLDALAAAVKASSQVGFSSAYAGIISRNPAQPAPTFAWGTTPATARDALIDLLRAANATESWEVRCNASATPNDHVCVMAFH